MITTDYTSYTWHRCTAGHLVLVSENGMRWRTVDRGIVHHIDSGCKEGWKAIAPELAATLTSTYLIGGPDAVRLLVA